MYIEWLIQVLPLRRTHKLREAIAMCELLAMSCHQASRLSLSLRALADRSSAPNKSRDGWGAAFYQGHDVALFREPAPAHDSSLVHFLEHGSPCTTLAMSHIRLATQGVISLANTQPFVREMAGRAHVFAHNGHLPGIAYARQLAWAQHQPIGETDSEHAFCALLERLRPLWRHGTCLPSMEERLAVVAAFAAELRQLGPANFLYADGDVLFAHGHRRTQPATSLVEPPGLVTLSRHCGDAQETLQAEGVSVAAGYQQVLLVASMPLSQEHWQPLPEGEVLAIRAGRVVGRRSMQT